jgi:hypothetical protein
MNYSSIMHVLFIRGRCKIEYRRKSAVFIPFHVQAQTKKETPENEG